MKTGAVVCLVALSGLGACADSTTAPMESEAEAVVPQAAMSMSMASAGALDFSTDLENLRSAVLPTFADAESAGAIKLQLHTLQNQLAAGDRASATATLAEVRAAIKPDATDATTLFYVGMVLANIDAALGTK